ncbi:MAG: ABC transporter ATP-binding protein [Rickettsiales bacterium]|nr:ABC transporter ATP-binding protein [Rickettsiales bacterium]
MNNAAIEITNLNINYNHKTVLRDITGNFKFGSLTAITGQNGAGKSTLLKAIAGLIKIKSGSVKRNISHKKIAYLPQISEIQRDFPISVLQLVTSGYCQKFGNFAEITKEMKDEAITAIKKVGLEKIIHNDISSLSLGQFQRALFARLIIQDANLILLDEPFTALDFKTVIMLTDLIKNWHKKGKTIICVLHDIEQIKNNFHDCIILNHIFLAWDKSEIALKNYHLESLNCCS